MDENMVLFLLLLPLYVSAAQIRPGTPSPMKPTPKPVAPKDTKQKHKDAKKRNLSVVMEGNYTFRKIDFS